MFAFLKYPPGTADSPELQTVQFRFFLPKSRDGVMHVHGGAGHGEERRWDVCGLNEGAQLTAVGSCLPVHPVGHRMGLHWSNWAGVGGRLVRPALSSKQDQRGPKNPSTGQPLPGGPGGVCTCLGAGFGICLPRGPTQQQTATRGYYSACTCQVSSDPHKTQENTALPAPSAAGEGQRGAVCSPPPPPGPFSLSVSTGSFVPPRKLLELLERGRTGGQVPL